MVRGNRRGVARSAESRNEPRRTASLHLEPLMIWYVYGRLPRHGEDSITQRRTGSTFPVDVVPRAKRHRDAPNATTAGQASEGGSHAVTATEIATRH